jgi:hypothetical protein
MGSTHSPAVYFTLHTRWHSYMRSFYGMKFHAKSSVIARQSSLDQLQNVDVIDTFMTYCSMHYEYFMNVNLITTYRASRR